MPRYVIIGAGAIGVTLAAELHRSGHPVALIARGAQLQAARADGITYARPHGLSVVDARVYGGPDELQLTGEDLLVLATKTQDAAAALALWSEQPVSLAGGQQTTAGTALPLLTTQNGLETERVALRHFETVYASVLILAATYVEPGVVVAPSAPSVGIAWIGAFPDRPEPRLQAIARDLRRANLETLVVDDISRVKNAKLAMSSTFVLDALYEPGELRDRAGALVSAETQEILEGAGGLADLSDDLAQLFPRIRHQDVAGYESWGGTSTWQSLTRSGSLETDYINGEVVLQARLQGRTAPINQALTDRIHAAQRDGTPARSLSDDDLIATVPQLTAQADSITATGSPDDVLIDARSLHHELLGPNPPAVLDVRWKLGDSDGRAHYAERHIPTAVYVDLETELAGPASPSRAVTRCRNRTHYRPRRGAGASARASASSSMTTSADCPPPAPGGCCAGRACGTSGSSTARLAPGQSLAYRSSPGSCRRTRATLCWNRDSCRSSTPIRRPRQPRPVFCSTPAPASAIAASRSPSILAPATSPAR